MDFGEIYHFLFETIEGIGMMIVVFLVLGVVYAAVAERKTRREFRDRGERKEMREFDEDE